MCGQNNKPHVFEHTTSQGMYPLCISNEEKIIQGGISHLPPKTPQKTPREVTCDRRNMDS